jgi:hypothetical protein
MTLTRRLPASGYTAHAGHGPKQLFLVVIANVTESPATMGIRCRALVMMMLTASACGLIACGGSNPASPTATVPISPAPVSLPPVNFSLEASADHFLFSSRLGQLAPGQHLDIGFAPVQINRADTEGFAHSVDFWLVPGQADPISNGITGVFSFGFGWSSGSTWTQSMRTPQNGFMYTANHPTLPLGNVVTVRIARRVDGTAEFWLGPLLQTTVPDSEPMQGVWAQVVGVRANFSYVPAAVSKD